MKELKNRDYLNNINNIKEISIASSFVFMRFNKYWYTDLLRISEHWVSYRRNNFMTKEVVAEWSYKTSKTNIFWESLTQGVIKVFQIDDSWMFKTDAGVFAIRITFKNNEHLDLELFSNFADNKLEELAQLIKQTIPLEETDYPDVLDTIPLFLYEHPLTKESLESLEKKDICALMYAESGAMGSPGEICVIDSNGRKYFDRGIFSDGKCDVYLEEITSAFFDGFKHIKFKNMQNYFINEQTWIYIDLGFGNHLFLRKDFWLEHGNRIADVNAARRYENWKKLIKETD